MERDGQVFVLLNGRQEPLFTVLGELVVCEEWNGEGDVGLWRSKVAVLEGFVDDMQCPTAARLFKVGGHATDGVDLQVSMFAAAKLFCYFEGGQGVFGEVAEKGESM